MYYIGIGVLGAAMTILIALASRSNFYLLSGLIPLFPAFAIIAYFMAKQRDNGEELGNVIQFNIVALVPYLAFALCMYSLHTVLNFYVAMSISIVVWMLTALLTYHLYNTYT